MTASALYRGWVRHRRRAPTRHEFRVPLFMVYLDLDELDSVFAGRWLWSTRRPAVARYCREDYLGDPAMPLKEAVLDRVAATAGSRPRGPVRMLTNLRYFGYAMNPVTFYYCFSEDGTDVEAIAAEITNTPWGERYTYVLTAPEALPDECLVFAPTKRFHVSPFMPMEIDYRWRLTVPGDHLVVHMENREPSADATCFDATLSLDRRPIDGRSLAAALLRHPWMTARVALGIYWNAALLKLKGTPFHAHPDKRGATSHAGARP